MAIKVATVTSIDRTVESVNITSKATQSDDKTSKFQMTPTPAGTNIKERWAKITWIVGRKLLDNVGSKANAASKITKPRTGPGIGSHNPRAINSPAS